MSRFIFHTSFLLYALTVSAQQTNKPRINTITAIPGDAPLSSPTCAASRAGYLETNGKKMTEAEIAKFVSSSLREGYILTIYPESKNGIFVNMECAKATPSHL